MRRVIHLAFILCVFASFGLTGDDRPAVVARSERATSRPSSRPSGATESEAMRRVEALLGPIPADIRFDADVVYRQVSGKKLRLDVYQNRSASIANRPAIIYVHGGAWKFGSKAMSRAMLLDLAHRGYVVFSIEYRLLPDGQFPRCIEDCKAAVRWVKAHAREYNIASDRIGVIGASAGAHLAALMAVSSDSDFRTGDDLDQSATVAAVVAYFGAFDLRGYGEAGGGLIRELVGESETDKPDLYVRVSPFTYVESAAKARGDKRRASDAGDGNQAAAAHPAPFPPFLLIHGDADELVDISQSRKMCKALHEAGCQAELIEVHGGTHGLMVGQMDPAPNEFRRKMYKFLRRYLGAGLPRERSK